MRTRFLIPTLVLAVANANAQTNSLDSATSAGVARLLAKFDASQSSEGHLNSQARADLFTNDGIFLNAFGGRVDGRPAIDSVWARMYGSITFGQAHIQIMDRKQHLIAPGMVVVDHLECLTGQRGPNSGNELPPRRTHITLILKQQPNSEWKIFYYRAGDLRSLPARQQEGCFMPNNPRLQPR
jgi:ketosteroid isomerase-like protein